MSQSEKISRYAPEHQITLSPSADTQVESTFSLRHTKPLVLRRIDKALPLARQKRVAYLYTKLKNGLPHSSFVSEESVSKH